MRKPSKKQKLQTVLCDMDARLEELEKHDTCVCDDVYGEIGALRINFNEISRLVGIEQYIK